MFKLAKLCMLKINQVNAEKQPIKEISSGSAYQVIFNSSENSTALMLIIGQLQSTKDNLNRKKKTIQKSTVLKNDSNIASLSLKKVRLKFIQR